MVKGGITLTSIHVTLNSIDKVKTFVNIISRYSSDFDLVSGRYVIDAKSIMGIFSLDLSYLAGFIFITSVSLIAVFIISSIPSSFDSERLIASTSGRVTGCLATNTVQQSS